MQSFCGWLTGAEAAFEAVPSKLPLSVVKHVTGSTPVSAAKTQMLGLHFTVRIA